MSGFRKKRNQWNTFSTMKVQKKMDITSAQTANELLILSIQDCNGASLVFPQDAKTLSNALAPICMNRMVFMLKPIGINQTEG